MTTTVWVATITPGTAEEDIIRVFSSRQRASEYLEQHALLHWDQYDLGCPPAVGSNVIERGLNLLLFYSMTDHSYTLTETEIDPDPITPFWDEPQYSAWAAPADSYEATPTYHDDPRDQYARYGEV